MEKEMRIYLLLSLCLPAFAQTTTITGMITDPAGDPLSGACSVQAVGPFTAASGWRVIGAPTVVRFSGGAFTFALAPTDSATPAGQYYKVTCSVPQQAVNGRSVGPYSWGPRYWLIPTNANSLDIGTVEMTSPPPSPSWVINWSQLAQNGAQVGQAPVWSGTSWQPGTALASAAWGLILGRLSDQADLRTAITPGGDLAGAVNAATVIGIQGNAVAPGAPADGQYMRWKAANSRWELVTFVDQETVAGTIDGINHIFTLVNAPFPPAGLVLFRNGIVQKQGFDYDLSGTAITFRTGAVPQPDDVLLAWYRY